MANPILNVTPSLVFPRNTKYNTIASSQISGRALRRLISKTPTKGYNLQFNKINCGEKDKLLAIFEAPFQLTTPDDGTVDVVILEESLAVSQDNPTQFSIIVDAEEVLFTG